METPPASHSALRVNWGNGRLRKYQSLSSFLCIFCEINGLSPKDARAYLVRTLGVATWQEAMTSPKLVRTLAGMLDEPTERVSSMMATIGPMGLEMTDVIFCPDCVRKQFYAIFHQYGWLGRCPLHLVELQQCHINERKMIAYFDVQVQVLTSLFKSEDSAWPAVPGKTPSLGSIRELRRLAGFVRWCAEARSALNSDAASVVWRYVKPPVNIRGERETATEELAILFATSAIPKPVAELMSKVPLGEYYKVVFPGSVAKELSVLTKKLPFNYLFEFYSQWWAWSGKARSGGQSVAALAEQWRESHRKCACDWLWDEYEGWVSRTAALGTRSSYQCPYERAAARIEERWGPYMAKTAWRKRRPHIYHFRNQAKNLEDLGVIRLAHIEDFEPCLGDAVVWLLPRGLRNLLEAVNASVFDIFVMRLYEYLAAVDSGCSPMAVPREGHTLSLAVRNQRPELSWLRYSMFPNPILWPDARPT